MLVIDTEKPIRLYLLDATRHFIESACTIRGVRRIALIGSLTTLKLDPKDTDVLVTIADDADLQSLATAGRRLKGRTQHRNHGADIFLADLCGEYVGRTCRYRECEPGIRMSCRAQHCGQRQYVNDDLHEVRLSTDLIKQPPVELWPKVIRHAALPPDVEDWVAGMEAAGW